MKPERIALIGLTLGLGLLAWYILKRNKKQTSLQVGNMPTNVSVGNKIATGYDAFLVTLTSSEIDDYVRKLDLLESQSKVLKSMGRSEISAEMSALASTIKGMNDPNLRSIADAWEARNKMSITKAIMFNGGLVDVSETVPELFRRLRALNY